MMRLKAIIVLLILLVPVWAVAEYRVTWIWEESIIIPCPQAVPSADEFGRDWDFSGTMTLELCWDHFNRHRQKSFCSYDEALEFFKRGQQESDLHDFVLELIEE